MISVPAPANRHAHPVDDTQRQRRPWRARPSRRYVVVGDRGRRAFQPAPPPATGTSRPSGRVDGSGVGIEHARGLYRSPFNMPLRVRPPGRGLGTTKWSQAGAIRPERSPRGTLALLRSTLRRKVRSVQPAVPGRGQLCPASEWWCAQLARKQAFRASCLRHVRFAPWFWIRLPPPPPGTPRRDMRTGPGFLHLYSTY